MRVRSWILLPILLAAVGQPRSMRAGGTLSASQTAKEIEDLGVIEAVGSDEVEGKPKFRASAQVRAEFSTNAKLTGNHSSGDLIFFPQVEVGFNVPMKHNFSFDIAGKLESGIYTDHEERGYIGYSIISTLDWRPKINWPRIYVGAEPYRYDSFDTGDKITEAIGLTAGTDWGYAFNKGYSMAFVGYSFSSYYADPSIDDRGQHRAIIGVSHQFGSRVVGSLFYQFSYSDFHNVERRDYRNLVGATATYQFTRGIFGVLTTSFVDNDSSQDFASYQAFNIGLGVNVQF